MARNLRGQFNYAINQSFKSGHGTSKHSDKKNGMGEGKIYSYSSRNNRLDVANQFSSWMRESHPGVKMANQVGAEHVQGFLLHKATSCSSTTIEQYRAQLGGLGDNINKTFNVQVNLNCAPVAGNDSSLIRTNPMTKEHFNQLKDSYKKFSTGYNALTIAQAGGCRVSEIAKLKNKDITISKNKASIFIKDGKGGRDRTIVVTDKERIEELQELKNHLNGAEARVCDCQTGSLMKNLNRHMTEIGIKGEYKHQGFHSIRKMYAQEEFDSYRKYSTQQESLNHVSGQLGHGAGRDLETLQRYIKDIY